MKRICFTSDLLFTEISNLKMIEDILLGILETGEVECWFHGCHRIINKQAVEVVMKIKKEHPQKSLSIVDVVDPIKIDSGTLINEEREEKDNFPKCNVDRFEIAPLIRGKAENHSNRFAVHAKKIDRWMWSQCDYMIMYRYPELPDRSIDILKDVKNFRNLKIIIMNNVSTKKLIEKRIQALQPEEKFSIESRRNGASYKNIAVAKNISLQRAAQWTRSIGNKIQRQVERDLREENNLYEIKSQYL